MTALSDVLRFALELAGVASLAVWGWVAGGSGLLHYVLAIGTPLVLIVVWAVFIAPNADSRSRRPSASWSGQPSCWPRPCCCGSSGSGSPLWYSRC